MPTLAELEAEMKDLQERLRATTMLVEAMRVYEATVGSKVHHTGNIIIRQRSRPASRPAPVMSETERVATDLMIRTGGPVPTAAVVDEMKRQGVPVPQANAVNIISARLSNNSKFKARRGVGYWLAERPWPGEGEDQTLPGLNENEASADHSEDASETALHAQP